MKKIVVISIIVISVLMVFIGFNSKSNYLSEKNILNVYLDSKLQSDIPQKEMKKGPKTRKITA